MSFHADSFERIFICGSHSVERLHLSKSAASCLSRNSVLVALENHRPRCGQFSFEQLFIEKSPPGKLLTVTSVGGGAVLL